MMFLVFSIWFVGFFFFQFMYVLLSATVWKENFVIDDAKILVLSCALWPALLPLAPIVFVGWIMPKITMKMHNKISKDIKREETR